MPASDPQRPAPAGPRRWLSSDGAGIAILGIGIAAIVASAGAGVAAQRMLSGGIDGINAGIDGMNASLDRFDADMNAGIDRLNASFDALEADFDRLFVLVSTLQEHERQLADDPDPPGSRVTP